MSGLQYPENDLPNGIIQSFYNNLLEFDTSITDSNLFFVDFTIPSALRDDLYVYIGETTNDWNIGINKTYDIFQSKIRTIITGVDLPDDRLNVKKIQHASSVNGFLPITVNETRDIDTTGLTTSFYDTNLSLNDFIFKPWIRLIARNGNFDSSLNTIITVWFLGKNIDFSRPLLRKKYTFYDCLPIDTQNKDEYIYAADPKLITHKVRWKFNRYDAKLITV